MTLAGLVAYAEALGMRLDILADSIAEPFEQCALILEENRAKEERERDHARRS